MTLDMTAQRFYDRTFNFHWAWTALTVGSLGIGMLACLAPLLRGGPPAADDRTAALIGCATMLIIALLIFGLAWRMRVVVTQEAVLIIWGYLNWHRMRFPIENIAGYRVVRFSPLRDFGGWGWRIGRGGARCYNTGGNEGVAMRIGEREYIIGVTDPGELAEALESAAGKTQSEAPGEF